MTSKQKKKRGNFMKNKAFTLIELLVVVLIIGILAAIAVPQYQKAVLKADLHRGISLVESLYQAQQAYYLQHGDFAADIDDLDISIPKDSSCEKKTNAYDCDYGRIYFSASSVQFQEKPDAPGDAYAEFGYTRYLKDSGDMFKAGKKYLFVHPNHNTAKDIALSMGGVLLGTSSWWDYYELK